MVPEVSLMAILVLGCSSWKINFKSPLGIEYSACLALVINFGRLAVFTPQFSELARMVLVIYIVTTSQMDPCY